MPCHASHKFDAKWILCGCAVKYSATDVYDGNVKLKELKVGCLSVFIFVFEL